MYIMRKIKIFSQKASRSFIFWTKMFITLWWIIINIFRDVCCKFIFYLHMVNTESTQSINSVLVLKNVRQCRSDGQKAVYATLHIINHLHIFGIGGGCAKMRRRRGDDEEGEDEERGGRGGEWRQRRRVRKPQITTINHQAVNIFTC